MQTIVCVTEHSTKVRADESRIIINLYVYIVRARYSGVQKITNVNETNIPRSDRSSTDGQGNLKRSFRACSKNLTAWDAAALF